MKNKAIPKNAADHLESSQALEVGGGSACLSFLSSTWNPATPKAYSTIPRRGY